METLEITRLIARAPWREAVTYRKTWPHEYGADLAAPPARGPEA